MEDNMKELPNEEHPFSSLIRNRILEKQYSIPYFR